MGAIRFSLTFSVPKGTDRQRLAQELADQWRLLSVDGEEINAAADVHVPEGLPEFRDDDHDSPVLAVRAWAERPWIREGEYRRTARAFYESARSWLQERYPVSQQSVSIMPLDDQLTGSLVNISTFVAHTSGPLPVGWEEHLAQHR